MIELEIHKALIKEQLTELLDTYYNGSFLQMVCEYIRATGMRQEEVEELLEKMQQQKNELKIETTLARGKRGRLLL